MNHPTARQALDRALDETEDLVLAYQPIHDVTTGAIYAAEALLRQRRRSGEIREASIITEAAEKSPPADLFALDSLLVKKAYTEAARWQAAHPGVRINVNLSPREFQEGNVRDRLGTLITACGNDTHKVNLEITESSYIHNLKETAQVLAELKELGVAIWLDDFGTGYSSLSHLERFPVDGVKLPGDFMKHVPRDTRATTIVRHLIALSRDLGIPVIAEGVERQEQLDFLHENRCEYVQGFLLSKPMAPEEFEELLDSRAEGRGQKAEVGG